MSKFFMLFFQTPQSFLKLLFFSFAPRFCRVGFAWCNGAMGAFRACQETLTKKSAAGQETLTKKH
jgi:hypothetical protein